MEKKIFKTTELLNKIKKLKFKNKKIGLCHGAFDLIHVGHIKHFKSSKKHCDFLIVSITKDEFIKKGPKRPIFNEKLRIETLAEISSIDAVILSEGSTAENIIRTIKPNFYFKGPDYKKHKNDLTNKINIEINLVKKYKGKVIYTSDEKYSSSKIINQNFSILNDDQKKLVKYIKNNFNFL